MPRLLILCEFPTLLGGEQSMLATLPTVASAGFDIVVAAPRDGMLAGALLARGIDQVSWETTDGQGKRFPLTALRERLESIFCSVRPDLVHANSLSTARIAGPVTSHCGIPSIGHLRDIISLTSQAVEDLNKHSALLAVSHATRDFHVAQGLNSTKCRVLYNGVDLAKFRPRSSVGYLHRQLGLPFDATLVAVIGQLGLRKGTDIALAAALQVAEQQPNVQWLIAGERTSGKLESEEFEKKLHDLADQPPLAGHVHFLGTRRDVAQWLAECTLLVHAARQEPLGRVLLEAAACGLAVVATDVGGTREIFPIGSSSAVLVPSDRPQEIAEAVGSLLNDADRRRALGSAARCRAEEAFDIRVAAKRLADIYEQVMQS